jgi:carbonic anhydrase/acetyltransferase-like protein (isoleucine patch superfamily)
MPHTGRIRIYYNGGDLFPLNIFRALLLFLAIMTANSMPQNPEPQNSETQHHPSEGDIAWPADCSAPDLSAAAFVAANATVMGQVEVAAGASIWYGAVVRGDVEKIVIGRCTNVQDGAVLHGDPNQPTVLEDYVTIGHRAVVHGAHIGRGSLVGIGAIVLNGVKVGEGSIVGAGSVVTKDVPAHSLVVGIPAKVLRSLSETEVTELVEHAERYEQLARVHGKI